MVRTQFQIDETTYEALRTIAHKQRKSMSAIVRDILHEHLEAKGQLKGLQGRTFSFIGAGASGTKDTSTHHDEALAEDFR